MDEESKKLGVSKKILSIDEGDPDMNRLVQCEPETEEEVRSVLEGAEPCSDKRAYAYDESRGCFLVWDFDHWTPVNEVRFAKKETED